MKSIALVLLASLWCMPVVWAQASDEDVSALHTQVQQLTELVEQLKDTVQSQAARLAQLEQAAVQPAQVAGAPSGLASRPSSSGVNLSAFNPEIGVLADIVGPLSERSEEGEGHDKTEHVGTCGDVYFEAHGFLHAPLCYAVTALPAVKGALATGASVRCSSGLMSDPPLSRRTQ